MVAPPMHVLTFPLLHDKNILTEYSDDSPSSVLLQLKKNDGFVYQNESEIRRYAMHVLEDVLLAMGIEDYLMVRPEISVFSYRPDVIVVQSTMGIVLVVKVKKPGTDVFTSHSVAGQVYDYLVGLLGMGVAYPFVILTTYEEMVIAHLDDAGKSRALMQEVAEVMENRLDEEKKFLKKGKRDDSEPSPGSSLRKPNLVVSTAQKSDVGISSSSNCDCGIDDDAKKGASSDDDGDWNRCLYYSKVVARERVFTALMFAVRCAIQSCIRSPPRHIPLQGSTPNFARARVNENGMIWGDLPSNIKVDYFTTPDKTTKSYYLLNDLGRGSNGRAYLICNSTGEACVAKFLIKDSLAHGGPREYEDNAFVYQNESEIQMYVVRLLQDVLLAMGLNKYLKV